MYLEMDQGTEKIYKCSTSAMGDPRKSSKRGNRRKYMKPKSGETVQGTRGSETLLQSRTKREGKYGTMTLKKVSAARTTIENTKNTR